MPLVLLFIFMISVSHAGPISELINIKCGYEQKKITEKVLAHFDHKGIAQISHELMDGKNVEVPSSEITIDDDSRILNNLSNNVNFLRINGKTLSKKVITSGRPNGRGDLHLYIHENADITTKVFVSRGELLVSETRSPAEFMNVIKIDEVTIDNVSLEERTNLQSGKKDLWIIKGSGMVKEPVPLDSFVSDLSSEECRAKRRSTWGVSSSNRENGKDTGAGSSKRLPNGNRVVPE